MATAGVFWRLFLFGFFTLLAAPIEYHVRWVAPWSRGAEDLPTALSEPLVHGALFFYSVIIVIEALFRLEMHPERATRRAAKLLKGWAYLMLLPFILYLVRGVDTDLTGSWLTSQYWIAACSLAVSLSVFLYMHVTDKLSDSLSASRYYAPHE